MSGFLRRLQKNDRLAAVLLVYLPFALFGGAIFISLPWRWSTIVGGVLLFSILIGLGIIACGFYTWMAYKLWTGKLDD